MYEVENENGIFCDAIVQKGEAVIFSSLWGRSAAIMSLYGGITTGTVSELLINGRYYAISKELNKHQTKMPKGSRYGSDLVHVMLYADMAVEPAAGQRVLLLKDDNSSRSSDMVWQTVKSMSEIGLLEHWKPKVLEKLFDLEWISTLYSIGVTAILIDLSERDGYEALISQMLRNGELKEEQ